MKEVWRGEHYAVVTEAKGVPIRGAPFSSPQVAMSAAKSLNRSEDERAYNWDSSLQMDSYYYLVRVNDLPPPEWGPVMP